MTEPGGRVPERRVWPLVVGASIVVGLLLGGGVARIRSDPAPPPSASATPSASTTTPPLALAQLDGTYRVTLIVRGARNLALLAGIGRPVPGERRDAIWRFFPVCAPEAMPCPASWEGRRPPLSLQGERWAGTIARSRAPCRIGIRTPAPIRLSLRPQDGVTTEGAWVVRSFVGTYAVAFRCPGFAPSRGVVEVAGSRA